MGTPRSLWRDASMAGDTAEIPSSRGTDQQGAEGDERGSTLDIFLPFAEFRNSPELIYRNKRAVLVLR